MLQEQMHRLAQSQMEQHMEIFSDVELKEIERGRNSDYCKEYYIQQKAEQLLALDEAIEEPKSELAKLSTKAWRTFRAWWDKNKRPEVEKTATESVLKKLQKHKQEATEQPVNDKKVDRKKDQYR